MERYLIAVDMDGTLLNSQGKITDRTVKVLKKLIEMGHYLVPASGRALSLLPKEILKLDGIQYAILENGSVVWKWKDQKPLKQYMLPKGAAQDMIKDVEQHVHSKYYVEVIANGNAYADTKILNDIENAAIEGNFIEYMKENHSYINGLSEQTQLLNTAEKVNIFFEDVFIGEEVRAKWRMHKELSVTTSVSGNAEFTVAGVNKGCGLKILQQYLKIPKSHTIAIGDNENDLEMFEKSGISVAMGNAEKYIQNRAERVTLDNDTDGVAVFLERYFKLCDH